MDNNDDLPLWQRITASDTSRNARQAANESGNRKRIYQFIRERGMSGATNSEIAHALQIPLQSVTPATYALVASGDVVRPGLTRLTPNRRAAVVNIATEHASPRDEVA